MDEFEKARELNFPKQKIPLSWPRTVESLCPVCLKHLDAKIYEKDNKVFMEKTCKEHGSIKECLSDDAVFFKRNEMLTFEDGYGQEKPITKYKSCPESCGLCDHHIGTPCLINIDLTNRCNMRCPVCFANSNSAGYVYEPTLEQVKGMIKVVRGLRPVAAVAVQFSGGEPTLSPIWFDALRAAKKMGISYLQAASNGIKFAKDPEFTKKSAEAGLNVVYLQFDGTNNEAYKYTRRISNLWEIKKKAVEEIGKAGMTICLVTTVVRGETDKNIGDIIQFAIDTDCVTSISLQPVSFTGRMDPKERLAKRFTLTDLATEAEKQTKGLIKKYDWFPMSIASPFSRLLDVLNPEKTKHMITTPHAHCGLGTYLCVNKKTKEAVPISKFLNVEGVMKYIDDLSRKLKGKSKLVRGINVVKAFLGLKKYFRKDKAPKGMGFGEFVKFMRSFTGAKEKEKFGKNPWKMVFVASMHFLDNYNYEIDRVRRCGIYFPSPEGRLYSFCTYNVGPYYRAYVEKKFSIPLKEWIKKRTKEGVTKGFYEGKV
ncbi:MAG: radical SAM protein [archaeon]|nr:MAG: radical SAM protein [archaeon]